MLAHHCAAIHSASNERIAPRIVTYHALHSSLKTWYIFYVASCRGEQFTTIFPQGFCLKRVPFISPQFFFLFR